MATLPARAPLPRGDSGPRTAMPIILPDDDADDLWYRARSRAHRGRLSIARAEALAAARDVPAFCPLPRHADYAAEFNSTRSSISIAFFRHFCPPRRDAWRAHCRLPTDAHRPAQPGLGAVLTAIDELAPDSEAGRGSPGVASYLSLVPSRPFPSVRSDTSVRGRLSAQPRCLRRPDALQRP